MMMASLDLEELTPYQADPREALDSTLASIVHTQPLVVKVERLDPINPDSETSQARYRFHFPGQSQLVWTKPIMCKLVDRVKKGVAHRKVLCKVENGWLDLDVFLVRIFFEIRWFYTDSRQ